MSDREHPEVEAWRQFCRGMEALGERILGEDFPSSPGASTDGIAHLAMQASCWLAWSIAHADTNEPFFHRNNDLVTPWGGPNQDNVYRHARIDPQRRYRVRGRMHGCEQFALTLRVGFMHMKEWGTKTALSSVDLGIESGDEFEILLGGDGSEPGCVPIPDGVTTVSVREYYFDWRAEEPATFTIECLDPAPSRRTTAEETADSLEHALEQVARSVLVWNDYLRERRARARDNEFIVEGAVAKGLPAARYAFLFWSLRPDDALVVETDVSRARYWGMQLASLGWFRPIDPVGRATSINHAQAFVDDDEHVRFVLAHDDPGVPNWLDVGGNEEGLLTYRWFWAEGDPTTSIRVVPLGRVRDELPSATPVVGAEARAAELAARKAHLAWRFRT